MAPPYTPPAWGVAGVNAHGVSLEVIKGGVVVETLALPIVPGQSFVVAGRMAPACDLELQHPSVSRVHAALQFDAHGSLFLRDLGSTHGTFVNKRRLPANEFVALHIGDVVAFGESTRLYAVCGPRELLPPERAPSRPRKPVQPKEEDTGASWGFREDAEEDEEEDEGEDDKEAKEQLPDYLRNLKEEDTPYKSTVKKEELNEKDARLFQQLQAKITKMENLKLEKARILAKQHQLSGLTDGQQQQLARNEQRIETLLHEIEEAEERIRAKNAQREQTAAKSSATANSKKKTKSVSEALYGYESDEDDFYDRTRSNQQRQEKRKQLAGSAVSSTASQAVAKSTGASKGEALTASAIEAKIRVLQTDLDKVKERLSAVEMEGMATGADDGKQEEVDSLDSFMNATSKQLVESDRDAIARRKSELERELARQRQLLAIATPALPSVPSKEASSTPQTQDKPVSAEIESPTKPPPASPSRPSNINTLRSQEEPQAIEFQTIQAPLKTTTESVPAAEDVGESSGASTFTDSVSQGSKSSPVRNLETAFRRSDTPTRSINDEPMRGSKKRRVAGPALPRGPARQEVFGETNVLEGGDRVWVPPKNQTGDGRTALNDKLGY